MRDGDSLWAGAPQSRLGYDASSFRTRGVGAGDVVFRASEGPAGLARRAVPADYKAGCAAADARLVGEASG